MDSAAKFKEACAFCSKEGTDKKWVGQFWHKKCLRVVRKGAHKMV